MKKLLLALVLCVASYAGETYKTNPNPGSYATGYGSNELTLEQHNAEIEVQQLSEKQPITYQWDVRQIGQFQTGYLGPGTSALPMANFDDGQPLKSIDLSSYANLHYVLDQKNCGSCVIFAVGGAWMDTMLLVGMKFPLLSMGHLMNCGSSGQCRGNFGGQVSGGLVKLGQLYTEADYPYIPASRPCKSVDGEKFGSIGSFKSIDTSTRSLLAALNAGHVIAGGVAADRRFMSYAGGVYNPESFSQSVNHYIRYFKIDCESAVDADNNCVFDEKGELPPGVGTISGCNSWGPHWGDKGCFTAKLTNSKGQRTNAMAYGAGNAQIYDVGVPFDPKPKEPVTFTLSSPNLTLTITVQPTAIFTVDQAKKTFQTILDSLGDK